MQSTTRATQPVCVISVSGRLVISNSARTEIVVPQEESFEKTAHKHRSTRNQQGSNESSIYINPLMPITTQQFCAGTQHRQQFQHFGQLCIRTHQQTEMREHRLQQSLPAPYS